MELHLKPKTDNGTTTYILDTREISPECKGICFPFRFDKSIENSKEVRIQLNNVGFTCPFNKLPQSGTLALDRIDVMSFHFLGSLESDIIVTYSNDEKCSTDFILEDLSNPSQDLSNGIYVKLGKNCNTRFYPRKKGETIRDCRKRIKNTD